MKFKHYPAFCIICPSDREGQYYNTFLPDTYIHYKFSDALVEQIFSRQQEICTKALISKKRIDPRLLLILDDVMESKTELLKSKAGEKDAE